MAHIPDRPFKDPAKLFSDLNKVTTRPGEPDKPEKCPTCDSPRPELHPAMQFEGEVQPCHDPWHFEHNAKIMIGPDGVAHIYDDSGTEIFNTKRGAFPKTVVPDTQDAPFIHMQKRLELIDSGIRRYFDAAYGTGKWQYRAPETLAEPWEQWLLHILRNEEEAADHKMCEIEQIFALVHNSFEGPEIKSPEPPRITEKELKRQNPSVGEVDINWQGRAGGYSD